MIASLLPLLVLAQAPNGHGPAVVHGPPAVVTSQEESRSAVHAYSQRPNPGFPILQVRGVEGAMVQVYQGGQRITAEQSPMSVKVIPEMFYTVQVQLTPELTFEKKVLVHLGNMGVLELWRPGDCGGGAPAMPPPPRNDGPPMQYAPQPPPPPQGPVAMDDGQFAQLVRAMRAEPREERRLTLLATAAQRNFFSVGQVGALVDLFSFGDGRVGVVRTVRGRIVDAENAFVLYEHFRFDSEKEQARRYLEDR